MEENAQEATREERGKQHKYQLKYHNIPYQNQNFISISRKNIVPLDDGIERVKEIYKNNALRERCSFLYYRRCDVFGFGEIEFLTDLG